jgi:hypothetical protein
MAKSVKDKSLEILIPVYKPEFSPIEQFSIDYSLAMMPEAKPQLRRPGWPRLFLLPGAISGGTIRVLSRGVLCFGGPVTAASCWGSDFYRRFLTREFILILQPDAIVLRDDLDAWMGRPYDYIGAPWPDGIEFTVRRDRFRGDLNRRIRTHVGNGGFSLRRTRKCLALLAEFSEMAGVFP